jgi:hypothetical protein
LPSADRNFFSPPSNDATTCTLTNMYTNEMR